jgi:hypothetical protein
VESSCPAFGEQASVMAAHSDKQLEQLWIKYQFNIAGLRGTLGPLFNVAFHARQAHTFNIGEGPETRAVHATMGPSPGEPNGIPDGHAVMTGPTYGARAASVMAASTILMTFDSAIQELATRLGSGRGANMQVGDRIANLARTLSEPASTLIWAAVNNIRHVDEWHASAATYSDPRSQGDIDLRERQNRSMVPLANVLGCKLPITDNIAFEVLQLLAELPNDQGSYDRVELHVLRIGQDAVQRAGLTGHPSASPSNRPFRPSFLARYHPRTSPSATAWPGRPLRSAATAFSM